MWVQAAEDMANRDVLIDDIVDDFYKNVGWITLPILLVLLVIDIAIFRRALLPLRQASEIAQQISPARTDMRLPLDEIPSEVRPLVSAINKALDRLDQGFRLQREFTADAAHELRTPLSILRTRVETLDDPRIAKALASGHRGDEPGGRPIARHCRARGVQRSIRGTGRCCRASSAEVADFIAPLALEQGREIALLGVSTPVWVKGNAEMIKRAIRNLAENAIKHAPTETVVEFVVEESGTVKVLDRGPGIAPEERELIFQRFWRRDRNQQGSTGLGLVDRAAHCRTARRQHRGREPGDGRRGVLAAFYSGGFISRHLTPPGLVRST